MKISEFEKEGISSKNQNNIFFVIMHWFGEKHFPHLTCNYSQFKSEAENFETEIDFLEFENDLNELSCQGYFDIESVSNNTVIKLIPTDKAYRLWDSF